MMQVLDVAMKKIGKHFAVHFEYNTESRFLRLNFAFLSTTKSEEDIKFALCSAFDLCSYVDHPEMVLPVGEIALDWVVGRFEMAEEILNRQVVIFLPH